jgi:hypothetical protein
MTFDMFAWFLKSDFFKDSPRNQALHW